MRFLLRMRFLIVSIIILLQSCGIVNHTLHDIHRIWMFPKIRVPQNGLFIMQNLMNMDDLGGKTLFSEIPTVDGQNPTPPRMMIIPLFIGF